MKIKCAVIECPTIGRWLFIENPESRDLDGFVDVDIYHMEGIEAEVIDMFCFHSNWEDPEVLYDKAEDLLIVMYYLIWRKKHGRLSNGVLQRINRLSGSRI